MYYCQSKLLMSSARQYNNKAMTMNNISKSSTRPEISNRVERSRQSARDCRVRKKIRYQYLEELVTCREKAIFILRQELEMLKQWCISIDNGFITPECIEYVTRLKQKLMSLNILNNEELVAPSSVCAATTATSEDSMVFATDFDLSSAEADLFRWLPENQSIPECNDILNEDISFLDLIPHPDDLTHSFIK